MSEPDARSSLDLLAADPTGARLDLLLPQGQVVDDTAGAAALWLSDGAADAALLARAHGAVERTGLWPVLLNMEGIELPPRAEQPPAPSGAEPRPGAEAVLAQWSVGLEPRRPDHDHRGCGTCLALLESRRSEPVSRITARCDQDPARTAAAVAGYAAPFAPRLALVACARSADVPTVLGWDGPARTGRPIAHHSAVLRRWEERYQLRVVALHGAGLVCSVASPPRTFQRALGLAVDHLAFCPDLAGEFESVNTQAEELVGTALWSFHWD
ncbi:DUF4253 domain-containing protein [Streptacidiphilus sp. P02-A3a]|uniref:DUF4253 domain-containing protein n=1 Tax=Streptacidiphilus sp. P02-A3a TaxID=2704468 RepID=UPI0015FADE64|nr:DUF4253 domain-containing protein [Streptacidiphilus sp. P02-A3a]QMU70116.1 DUF4253 domain-containing protein [Streptacidiphilus sp. P02-A3a]QMU70431.1 DUF4253 domain-containing protein [Streptacidiphilus sp. P02-A3a]